MSVRYIVDLGDTHCGSTVGLCPPGFKVQDGGTYGLNDFQKELWACWLDFQSFIKETVGGKPYALVHKGDSIEGVHHGTKQVVSVEASDHVAMAKQVLEPIADGADSVWVVRGTETHVGQAGESAVGFLIGAEKDEATGQFAHHHVLLEVDGIVCSFRHHMGATSRPYLEAGSLSIALGSEMQEAVLGGQVVPKVYSRGHRHRFGVYSNGSATIACTPSWQGLTNYGHRAVTGARQEFGGVIWDFEVKTNGLPTARPKTYPLSPRAPVRL